MAVAWDLFESWTMRLEGGLRHAPQSCVQCEDVLSRGKNASSSILSFFCVCVLCSNFRFHALINTHAGAVMSLMLSTMATGSQEEGGGRGGDRDIPSIAKGMKLKKKKMLNIF